MTQLPISNSQLPTGLASLGHGNSEWLLRCWELAIGSWELI